jgi:hypothetical protein
MRPLKCWAWKPVCAWNGHKPVPGTRFSRVYYRHVECLICDRCHKVLS